MLGIVKFVAFASITNSSSNPTTVLKSSSKSSDSFKPGTDTKVIEQFFPSSRTVPLLTSISLKLSLDIITSTADKNGIYTALFSPLISILLGSLFFKDIVIFTFPDLLLISLGSTFLPFNSYFIPILIGIDFVLFPL